jgi:hypothetical protein
MAVKKHAIAVCGDTDLINQDPKLVKALRMRLRDCEWETESKTEMKRHRASSKDFAFELTF